MSRSYAHRKKRSIASSAPRWMCWPSVLSLPANPKSQKKARQKTQDHKQTSHGMPETPVAVDASSAFKLRTVGAYRGIRVLAWDRDILYGCRGYDIVRLQPGKRTEWEVIARFRPSWWRSLTSRTALTYRLVRDGFHALAVLHVQTDAQNNDLTK